MQRSMTEREKKEAEKRYVYEQLRKNAKPFDVNDVGNRSEHSFENIENTVDFHEWLHEKQVEMAPKPNRADVIPQEPISPYIVEITRIKETLASPSLSPLTLPSNVSTPSSFGSLATSPAKASAKSATSHSAPRRSSIANRNLTPSARLKKKQIEQTNQQLLGRKNRNLLEKNDGEFIQSTPNPPRKSFLPEALRIEMEGADVVSSSDENLTIPNDENESPVDVRNKSAVETVPTSTTVNPVQAPVNESPPHFQQQKSTNMQSPQNSSKGVPPAWAQTKNSVNTPKTSRNQLSRLPIVVRKPIQKLTEVVPNAVNEQPKTPELTANNRSNRNDKSGPQTLVVAVTSPTVQRSQQPMVSIPSIHLNVNLNARESRSPMRKSTTANEGECRQIVSTTLNNEHNLSSFQLSGSESGIGGPSNQNLLTDDSDTSPNQTNKKNDRTPITTPTPSRSGPLSAKRQLIQSFESRHHQSIDNRTHTINDRSETTTNNQTITFKRNSRTQTQIQNGNDSNTLPPINTQTFDKQPSIVSNATYDIVQSAISSRTLAKGSMLLDASDVDESNVINAPEIDDYVPETQETEPLSQPMQQYVVDQESIMVSDSSYDSEDADAEVARVTGKPESHTNRNGSSDRSDDSDGSVGPTKTPQEVIEEASKGNISSSWNPIVAMTRLAKTILNRSDKSATDAQKNPIDKSAIEPEPQQSQNPNDKSVAQQSQRAIRESESFSGVVPPIEFSDDPIIRDKTPERAQREFNQRISLIRSLEQSSADKSKSLSQPKKRRTKPVNPEVEAYDRVHEEILNRRTSSITRSNGRKLYNPNTSNDDDDDGNEEELEMSNTALSSSLKQNDNDNVFVKPTEPPPKRKKRNDGSSRSVITVINKSDEIQATCIVEPIVQKEVLVDHEDEKVKGDDDRNEVEDQPAARKRKTNDKVSIATKSKRSTRTKSRKYTRSEISQSNIIDDEHEHESDDNGNETVSARRSSRVRKQPTLPVTLFSHSNARSAVLETYIRNINTTKSKSGSVESTQKKHKEPAEKQPGEHSMDQPKKQSKKSASALTSTSTSASASTSTSASASASTSTSTSASNKKSQTSVQNERSDMVESDPETNMIDDEMIEQISKEPWWNKLCDWDAKLPDRRMRVKRESEIESISTLDLDYEESCPGVDFGMLASLHNPTPVIFMRFQLSAEKPIARTSTKTSFFVLAGEFTFECDGIQTKITGGSFVTIDQGHRYSFKNIGDGIGVIQSSFSEDD